MQPQAYSDTTSPVAKNTIPAFSLINDQLGQVRKLIKDLLTVSFKGGDINQLLEHLHSHSGKMIRPGLVLLAGKCFGKITDEHIRVAAIIEMVHNATLLHDDVIDEGQTRRGRPTINKLWGNESAVLLGDYLLSRVFNICMELPPRAARTIACAAVRVCEGELRQVTQKQNLQLSESEHIEIITEKSAVLFSSCCNLGALLSQANEQQAKSLSDFGLNIGIAFQITDDLLDITGDEDKTGKTLGTDLNKYKLTLAAIHLLKNADLKEKAVLTDFYNNSKKIGKDIFAEMLSRHGSLEYAHSRAQAYIDKAVLALADLKESDAKEALIATAKFIADRTA
jgi:octaprenyl-diphosphate synthase